VELWSLPQDSVSEVPATTSYKFLLTGQTIAVVDPESRKVIQIIPNCRTDCRTTRLCLQRRPAAPEPGE
jgi:hypothetical protein